MHTTTKPFHSLRVALGVVCCALGAFVAFAPPTHAAELTPGFKGIDVVQIDGLLDPPNASLLRGAITRAEKNGSTALIIQIDSEGSVDTDPWALAQAVRAAKVPVAVWVGPAGAVARGGSALLAVSAPYVSLASNAQIGAIEPLRLDGESVDQYARDAVLPVVDERRDAVDSIRRRSIGAKEAKRIGLADSIDPVIGELIVGLDGKTIDTASGSRRLSTAAVEGSSDGARRTPNQFTRFQKLSITGQFQHTLGAPWAAYFLFCLGGCLLVFEFFTISIGIAGVVGALCFAFACFGFSHLPVQPWGIALLVLAFIAYAIDVQAGGLGPWTFIGTAALIGGSLVLYDGDSRLDPSWWVIVLVVLGVILFMLAGMTAMLRSRFSTPTVGREGMIGEMGTAQSDIAPDGLIGLRGTVWKARTNRATPIKSGDAARVIAVDGLVLEVEPESGGAKDYRHRGPKTETENPV